MIKLTDPLISEEMKAVIKKDLESLDNIRLGCKTKKEKLGTWNNDQHCFKPITKDTWMFHHGRHANPSSTKLSQISSIIEVDNEDTGTLYCNESHQHFLLDSFLYDNSALICRLQQVRQSEEVIKTIEQFMLNPVMKGEVHPYAYKFQPNESVYSIDENTWTKRLVGSLRKYLHSEVIYSAETKDFRENFACYTSIPEGSIASHVQISIFRGSPDTIIKRNPVTIVKEEEEDDSEDEPMIAGEEMLSMSDMMSSADSDYFIGETSKGETSKQQNQMNAVVHGLPEKLGELVANMWWMGTAKLVKRILKGKGTQDITIEGFLLDKAHGALHVHMTFHLDGTKHKLKVLSCANGVLSSDILCRLFNVF